MFPMKNLVFLKLGGSLITDKNSPYTARLEMLSQLACEIAAARRANPQLRLVLGHGSGSFGHTDAKKYATRQGLPNPPGAYWYGFSQVGFQAAALNRLVMEALRREGAPAVALSPVASIVCVAGKISRWNLVPLRSALRAGLIPVVYGDVVFDRQKGGTILSTEEIFEYLALRLKPERILLAGQEAGVWGDFPARTYLLEKITPSSLQKLEGKVRGSQAADVTGGMDSKVRETLSLVQRLPGLQACIFSGAPFGNTEAVLRGENRGTLLRADTD